MQMLSPEQWQSLLDKLAEPFDANEIKYRAGPTNKNKTRTKALPYADPRTYERRLDEVCPGNWAVDFAPWGADRIICKLRIHGVDRSSTGEFGDDDFAPGTSAEAQAFKRACSKFGLGRYLYELDAPWMDYDPKTKQVKASKAAPPRNNDDDAIAAYQAEREQTKPANIKAIDASEAKSFDELMDSNSPPSKPESEGVKAYLKSIKLTSPKVGGHLGDNVSEEPDEAELLDKATAQKLHVYLSQKFGKYLPRLEHYDVASEAVNRPITSLTQICHAEKKAVVETARRRAFEARQAEATHQPTREAQHRGYN